MAEYLVRYRDFTDESDNGGVGHFYVVEATDVYESVGMAYDHLLHEAEFPNLWEWHRWKDPETDWYNLDLTQDDNVTLVFRISSKALNNLERIK